MAKWLAKSTLTIPGKSNYPDQGKGIKCPHCGATIYFYVIIKDPKTGEEKSVCPCCGK